MEVEVGSDGVTIEMRDLHLNEMGMRSMFYMNHFAENCVIKNECNLSTLVFWSL